MQRPSLTLLGSGETVAIEDCSPAELAGATLYRAPDGRWLAPAFRSHAVALNLAELPDPDDEAAVGDVVLAWVEAVRAHDWSDLRGTPGAMPAGGGQRLAGDADWLDLRTTMVRVGWGPAGAQAAFQACRTRPYSRTLPTAAGWAGAGWIVPAVPDDPEPAFAGPVLEARGLLRWAYIARWSVPAEMPDGPPPTHPDPTDLGWADVLSRLRQDHYTGDALLEAEQLAVEVLGRVGLGPRTAVEAEDEALPDRDVVPACTHASAVVREAAWFLLRLEADTWLACAYAECQHHWAVEAEEDAYELEEVLELAGYGVPTPVDAAYQRRRLLTLAFGDVRDVALAGAGDVADFVAFYTDWVARGRDEEEFEATARELGGEAPS